MDDTQVQVQTLRPLTKERVERLFARIATIHEDMRRQGIDPTNLADPVEILQQVRDGTLPE
jgi:hypothetical protein